MKDIVCRVVDGEQVVEGVEHVLVKHSPTGFAWGYGGSGPAELALNILYAVTGDEQLSDRLHQSFKWDFIATMPEEGGIIRIDDVKEWLKNRAA